MTLTFVSYTLYIIYDLDLCFCHPVYLWHWTRFCHPVYLWPWPFFDLDVCFCQALYLWPWPLFLSPCISMTLTFVFVILYIYDLDFCFCQPSILHVDHWGRFAHAERRQDRRRTSEHVSDQLVWTLPFCKWVKIRYWYNLIFASFWYLTFLFKLQIL